MSLPIKKVYVNSRYKTADSTSDSNFKFELPYVLTMPSNAIFYITDVCIPNLFKTISRSENDQIWVRILSNPVFLGPFGTVEDHNMTIPPGNYTELGFAQALDVLLKLIGLGCDYDSTNNCLLYTSPSPRD